MAIEREYKLDSSGIADPLKVEIGTGLSKVAETRKQQLSLYFDSAGLDLGRLGIGLRFRTVDDEPIKGVWTMKIPRNFNSAGATQREEIEVEGERSEIPGPIRKVLQRLNLLDSLIPTVSLKTDRTSFKVARDGVKLPIEIDVDLVEFLDGSIYREVEIEVQKRELDGVAASIAGRFESAGGIPSKKTKLERATERSPYGPLAETIQPDLTSLEFWLRNGLLLSSLMLSSLVALPGEVEAFSFRGVVWEAVCYLRALVSETSEIELLLDEYAELSGSISEGRDFIASGDRLAESIYNLHFALFGPESSGHDALKGLDLSAVLTWDDEYLRSLLASVRKLDEVFNSIEDPPKSMTSVDRVSLLVDELLDIVIGAVPIGMDITLAKSAAEFFDLAVGKKVSSVSSGKTVNFHGLKIALSQLLKDLELLERA